MNDISDDDLMGLYGDGDVEAFEVLFDRYHVPVYNFARMMLGEADGAQDVLQETFLAVARTAPSYTPRGRFRAWLMRIVRNRCLNRLDAMRARRQALRESGFEACEPSAHQRVESDEQATLVRQAIDALPDRQREAVVLWAFERMKYREIAEVLDVPMGTVKTLIHRARARLARTLVRPDEE